MKKFIAISILILVASFQLTAQDRTYQMNYPNSYYSFTAKASDTVSRNDTAWYAQVLLSQYDYPVKSDWEMRLDEVSGAGAAAISLQGKKFLNDATWTNITTVNYASGGSDTTFTISDGTARLYRYFRIYIDKAAGTGVLEVERLQVKFWQTQ